MAAPVAEQTSVQHSECSLYLDPAKATVNHLNIAGTMK